VSMTLREELVQFDLFTTLSLVNVHRRILFTMTWRDLVKCVGALFQLQT
jgi:hypothetical protein